MGLLYCLSLVFPLHSADPLVHLSISASKIIQFFIYKESRHAVHQIVSKYCACGLSYLKGSLISDVFSTITFK